MEIINKRLVAAIQIVLNPQDHKVCEGCDSIVKQKTIICPSCHAYRYNCDVDFVVSQAKHLSVSEQKSVTKEDMF